MELHELMGKLHKLELVQQLAHRRGTLFLDRYLPPVGGFFISQESASYETKKAGMIPAERKPV